MEYDALVITIAGEFLPRNPGADVAGDAMVYGKSEGWTSGWSSSDASAWLWEIEEGEFLSAAGSIQSASGGISHAARFQFRIPRDPDRLPEQIATALRAAFHALDEGAEGRHTGVELYVGELRAE